MKASFSSPRLEEVLAERDPPWRENGRHFINSVATLLERLLEYRGLLKVGRAVDSTPPYGVRNWNFEFGPLFQSECSSSQHMSCIASLIHFYRSESNRQELYLRYVHKLYDLHIQVLKNPTNAGHE